MLFDAAFDTPFAHGLYTDRYQHPEDKNWDGTSRRVSGTVFGAMYATPKAQGKVTEIERLTEATYNMMSGNGGFQPKTAMPGGRYLYAAGRDFNQVNNCVLLNCPDSREGFAMTSYQAEMALMTGAGIGVWYGDVRGAGALIKRTGGKAAGPIPKMGQINDTGRHVIAGGERRSAIWAGLPWWHSDIFDFITVKDWDDDIRAMKAKYAAIGKEFPAIMDMTNISVTLDDEFFAHYSGKVLNRSDIDWYNEHGFNAPDGGTWESWARNVYRTATAHMITHGEPGFTVDVGKHAGEVLRNACTEITSADDSDICNLGSLVLPRFDSPEQFGQAVRDFTMFLTAGSVYSQLPYPKIEEVRTQNRRLGLGLIGVHEFLMKNGVKYGTDDAYEVLDPYMKEYARALEYAQEQQNDYGLSPSIGATAIAPNGTIGAVAESTPSADPMFSSAEIRTVVTASPHGDQRKDHIVVDPTAARLVAEGVPSHLIEDAHTLSLQPERRLAQQAYLQDYTDHAISSTVNLHAQITDPAEQVEFGDTLMEYLPRLRGITCYPDGAIAGQPRKPCDLEWALQNINVEFDVEDATCNGSVCG